MREKQIEGLVWEPGPGEVVWSGPEERSEEASEASHCARCSGYPSS